MSKNKAFEEFKKDLITANEELIREGFSDAKVVDRDYYNLGEPSEHDHEVDVLRYLEEQDVGGYYGE